MGNVAAYMAHLVVVSRVQRRLECDKVLYGTVWQRDCSKQDGCGVTWSGQRKLRKKVRPTEDCDESVERGESIERGEVLFQRDQFAVYVGNISAANVRSYCAPKEA